VIELAISHQARRHHRRSGIPVDVKLVNHTVSDLGLGFDETSESLPEQLADIHMVLSLAYQADGPVEGGGGRGGCQLARRCDGEDWPAVPVQWLGSGGGCRGEVEV